ncbi:MAG: hypothetical protein NXY57DRAFT_915618, partial [Lentinula lateritia]
MAIFSQELVDYILDFLHTSVPCLASSSLVSRMWLPATRYHLFHIPVLYQVSLHRSAKDNTRAFLELLESPLCTFRNTIQGCVLNIQWSGVLQRCVDLLATHTKLTGMLLIVQYHADINFTKNLQISHRFPS